MHDAAGDPEYPLGRLRVSGKNPAISRKVSFFSEGEGGILKSISRAGDLRGNKKLRIFRRNGNFFKTYLARLCS